MKVKVWLPEYADEFYRAFEWATEGLLWEQTHDDDEIIAAAVNYVPTAEKMIRRRLEEDITDLAPEDAVVEVGAETVAALAILLALEDLEGWGEWHREDFLFELVKKKRRAAWWEAQRYEEIQED